MKGEEMNPTETMPLTKKVAAYVAEASFEKIPSNLLKTIKDSVIDTIGCGILGSTSQFGKLIIDYVTEWRSLEESVIWGTNRKASVPFAAMANCASIHSWDFDDTVLPGIMHTGSVVIPPALSIAEKRKGVSGREFLTALALGYEVGNLIMVGLNPRKLISAGFYSTIPSIFAPATTAGKLLNLNEEQLSRAFSITATQAAGLYSATLTKRINSPKAVLGAVFAAQLAKKGLEASTDVLEADYSGFLRTFSQEPQMDVIARDLGKFAFDIFHKYYPCIRSNHPAVENVRKMMDEHPDMKPDKIDKITVYADTSTIEWTVKTTGGGAIVETVGNALISLPYCVAAMMVDGELTLDQFTEEKVKNRVIQDLLKKVELVVDGEIDKLPYEQRYRCTVEIKLKDGTVYKRFLAGPKGDPTNRMTREEMYSKFMKNATRVFKKDRMKEFFNILENIEELKDVSKIAGRSWVN